MAFLGKEKLLVQAELEIKQVMFKNGDWVYVREMTGKERNNFENSIMRQEKDANGVLTGQPDGLLNGDDQTIIGQISHTKKKAGKKSLLPKISRE